MDSDKPTLLFIAAWWPRDESPHEGLFILEHARCLSRHYNLIIIHLKVARVNSGLLYKIKKSDSFSEDGFRVFLVDINLRVRRFGLHDYLVRKAYDQTIKEIQNETKVVGFILNVRNHLTRFAPYSKYLDSVKFIHIEHFNYYHREVFSLPPDELREERHRLKKWFSNPNLVAVMPVSEDLKNSFQNEFGCAETLISVIPNVANEVFQFTEKIHHSESYFELLAVAIWDYPKRPKLLLEAVSLLPEKFTKNIRIHFIGDGKALSETKEYHKLHEHSMEVIFHGFQSKFFIAEKLQSVDFLVHPSDSENAPTVISEALCCGTPVLSMKINGIPEMVNDSNGILVEPGNAQKLADGLILMFDNLVKFDRKEIAENAQKIYSREAVKNLLHEKLKVIF